MSARKRMSLSVHVCMCVHAHTGAGTAGPLDSPPLQPALFAFFPNPGPSFSEPLDSGLNAEPPHLFKPPRASSEFNILSRLVISFIICKQTFCL